MEEREEELFLAVENDEIELVRKLVSKRILGKSANVAAVNDYGSTPLHIAALNNRHEIGRLLLDAGAPVNAVDGDSRTPLHIAAMHDHVKFIRMLLSAKADINVKDQNNQTPICFAVMNKCAAGSDLLLKRGADPNADLLSQSNPGMKLLHFAIKNDLARIVDSLLRKGADVKLTDYAGKDALNYAENASPEVINVLAGYNLVEKSVSRPENEIEKLVLEYRRREKRS